MSYSFPPHLHRWVKAHLFDGRYASEDDVLRDALLALNEVRFARPPQPMTLEQLQREVRLGTDQLQRGEGIPMAEVFQELLGEMETADTRSVE